MVKVKANRNCKFSYNGQRFVFKEEEERDIDVPIEIIDTRSFDILERKSKIKEVIKEKEVNE